MRRVCADSIRAREPTDSQREAGYTRATDPCCRLGPSLGNAGWTIYKEQQLDLFADRTSAHEMRANQLRLYLSSFAYVLLHGLRRLGTQGTELARAQCGTLRLRLLKVAARIRITARRVWLSLPQTYPYGKLLASVLANLRREPPWHPSRRTRSRPSSPIGNHRQDAEDTARLDRRDRPVPPRKQGFAATRIPSSAGTTAIPMP